MSVVSVIKSNDKLKKFIYWLLVPSHQARPREWVKVMINPFKHKRGKGSTICRMTRMDVLPFQPFTLGNYSTIEDFATVNNGVAPVNIGNHVILAQNIVASGLNHGYENINNRISLQPVSAATITIEDEIWIGANAVLTAGVSIVKHSVVAGLE